ncbi:MAG: tyrosine-type recombinase/integrase [Polaribacter sp.]|jgi:integrase/recombinase XerD
MNTIPIIYQPLKNAKRIKIYIPYELKELRYVFKKVNTTFWHPNQKLWSIMYTQENLALLKKLFGKNYRVINEVTRTPIKKRPLNPYAIDQLFRLEKALVLKKYSDASIRIYKNMFTVFLTKFVHRDITEITKEEIEGFVYELIKKNKISESYQNQLINAIKAYYEHALGKPREYYDIQRPKRTLSIPNVLHKEEVLKIIQHPTNIKHKAILWTIYSAGLRISEVLNLRIVDVHSKEGYLFIKDSKGKKDRKTILSDHLVTLLRLYYSKEKPSYWLFEGQTGGKYSSASIRAIFRKAVEETHSNPWSTVHTLRHSFATHCIEDNINLRYLQNMLGHNSPKTTEIYTKTIHINNKKIKSPLDNLLNNTTLET